MSLPPVLSALLRNKTGLILISLQIALTLAIVTNAVYLIVERVNQMSRPSGLDEDNLFAVNSLPFAPGFNEQTAYEEDLRALRSMPGVVDAVSIVSGLPLSGGGWSEGISTRPLVEGQRNPDQTSMTLFNVDDHGINTMGLKLIEGRNFTPEEIGWFDESTPDWPDSIILSQALANRLFPGESAVGKQIYSSGDQPRTVIGVVERLQSPWVNWEQHEQSALVPVLMGQGEMRYLIRTEPGQRDKVMGEVEALLLKINDGRIIRGMRDYDEIRARGYRRHRVTAITLMVVVGALLAITALGIVGMASFWVAMRTKQIGTRRALGARKRDVLRYFQAENLFISGFGVLFGALFAFALNAFLMQRFDVPRLEWLYVPVGALALLALGQLAVLGPALRGAAVHPSVATRSV